MESTKQSVAKCAAPASVAPIHQAADEANLPRRTAWDLRTAHEVLIGRELSDSEPAIVIHREATNAAVLCAAMSRAALLREHLRCWGGVAADACEVTAGELALMLEPIAEELDLLLTLLCTRAERGELQ